MIKREVSGPELLNIKQEVTDVSPQKKVSLAHAQG